MTAILAVLACALIAIKLESKARFTDVETSTANTVFAATEPVWLANTECVDGVWNSPHWVVSMYGNERKEAILTFGNSDKEEVPITFIITPESHDDGNLTFGFDKEELVIPAEGEASVTFWIEASQSVTPGTYSITVEVDSEWWSNGDNN